MVLTARVDDAAGAASVVEVLVSLSGFVILGWKEANGFESVSALGAVNVKPIPAPAGFPKGLGVTEGESPNVFKAVLTTVVAPLPKRLVVGAAVPGFPKILSEGAVDAPPPPPKMLGVVPVVVEVPPPPKIEVTGVCKDEFPKIEAPNPVVGLFSVVEVLAAGKENAPGLLVVLVCADVRLGTNPVGLLSELEDVAGTPKGEEPPKNDCGGFGMPVGALDDGFAPNIGLKVVCGWGVEDDARLLS